jgi:hypothetical protein
MSTQVQPGSSLNTSARASSGSSSHRVGSAPGVSALALSGHRLLVGGDPFGLVALDSRTGPELVRAVLPCRVASPYSGGMIVYAITVTRSTVYVGGHFSTVGTRQRAGVAALDSRTTHVTNWYPGFAALELGVIEPVAAAGSVVRRIGGRRQRSEWSPRPTRGGHRPRSPRDRPT